MNLKEDPVVCVIYSVLPIDYTDILTMYMYLSIHRSRYVHCLL